MSSSRSSSEENLNIQEFKTLKPYDHEPKKTSKYKKSMNSEDIYEKDEEIEEDTRTGNIYWCRCNNCKPMMTFSESICCKDNKEVPLDFFENCQCITETDAFKAVCLYKPVLKTSLSALNNLRGDKIDINNESFRFAGYKQFTWWVHNHLGKGVRKVIPSCAVWAIRDAFPNNTGVYVPFKEHKEDECRYLNYSS